MKTKSIKCDLLNFHLGYYNLERGQNYSLFLFQLVACIMFLNRHLSSCSSRRIYYAVFSISYFLYVIVIKTSGYLLPAGGVTVDNQKTQRNSLLARGELVIAWGNKMCCSEWFTLCVRFVVICSSGLVRLFFKTSHTLPSRAESPLSIKIETADINKLSCSLSELYK